jgi:hypothetical protein
MRTLHKISTIGGMTLAVAFLGLPPSGRAMEFGTATTYPVGTSPTGIVVRDFNGDGKPGIAVANSGSANISILLGNGDGTLQAAVNFDAGMANLHSLAIGDFNHDGKLDLAVFNPGDSANLAPGAVSILLGNGDGTFQAPKTLALTFLSAQLAVADFNADGNSDLAVSELDPSAKTLTVDILIGKGDGTFLTAKGTPVPNSTNGALALADERSSTEPP